MHVLYYILAILLGWAVDTRAWTAISPSYPIVKHVVPSPSYLAIPRSHSEEQDANHKNSIMQDLPKRTLYRTVKRGKASGEEGPRGQTSGVALSLSRI